MSISKEQIEAGFEIAAPCLRSFGDGAVRNFVKRIYLAMRSLEPQGDEAPDLVRQWQEENHEWFKPDIAEIVEDFAKWMLKRSALVRTPDDVRERVLTAEQLAVNDLVVRLTEHAIMELDADEENTLQIEAWGKAAEKEIRATLVRTPDDIREGLREWALDKAATHHRLAHENQHLRGEHIASSTAYRNLADEITAIGSQTHD